MEVSCKLKFPSLYNFSPIVTTKKMTHVLIRSIMYTVYTLF